MKTEAVNALGKLTSMSYWEARFWAEEHGRMPPGWKAVYRTLDVLPGWNDWHWLPSSCWHLLDGDDDGGDKIMVRIK